MFAPAGQTTARAGLRSKLAALVVRRQAPPNPRRGRGRPPCQRGLAALAAWGIPTGFAELSVTPADGQESLRLACARHLPLTREAFLAGFARAKGSPSGELAEPARPEGSRRALRYHPSTVTRRQPSEPFRPSLPLGHLPCEGRLSSRALPAQKGSPSGVTPRCAGRCRGATEGSGPEGLAELARPEGL